MSGNTIGAGYCQCHVTNRPGVDQALLHPNPPSNLQEMHPQRQLSRPRHLPQPPQQPSKFVLQRFDLQKNPDKGRMPVQKKSKWSVSKVFLRPQQPKEDAPRTEVSTLRPPESLAISGLSGSAQNIQRFCTCPKTIGQYTANQQYNNAEEYNANSYGPSGVDRKIRFWTKLGFGRDLYDPENSRTTPNVNENNASNTSTNKSNECPPYVYNNNNDCEEDDDDIGNSRQHSAHRCCQRQQCAFLSDSLSSPTSSRQRHRFHCHGNMSSASCLSDVCHGLSSCEATAATSEAADAGVRSSRKRRDLSSRSCSIGSSSTSFETTEARNTCARNPTSGLLAKPFRLIGCILSAQILAVVIFFWMFLGLGYSFPISASFSALLAAIMGILLSASKYLRCTAAILIPSASTAKGRLGVVLLIGSLLVGGPIRNVYLNITEVSRSLVCSQEQSFNQLEILLRPYDHMMLQLNGTVRRLQQASENVRRKLRPMERRMDEAANEKDAAMHQEGSKKTCKVLVETALDACLTGIQKAQDQCFEVMGALGTVYHHARVVLDRINPERWSNKQPTLLQQTNQPFSNLPHSQNYPDALDYPFNQKRIFLMESYQKHLNLSSYRKDSRRGDGDDYYHQDGTSRGAATLDSEVRRMSDGDGVDFGQGFEAGVRKRTVNDENSAFMEDLDLTGSDRDICEPLDTGMVCQSLNDSDTLCKLSDWAGEVIQEAINSTQIAIRDLELVLQFREPYARLQNVSLDKWGEPQTNEDSRSKPSLADQQRQGIRHVKADAVFARVTRHFVTFVSFLERLLPLGILIIIYAAHCYIQEYNKNVTYDNYFITSGFKNIDRARVTTALNGKPHNSTAGLNGTRHGSLFPLKNYEKLFVIDATNVGMSHREKHIWRVGMCLYFLFFILTIILYLFDYIIFWLLKLASVDAKLNPNGSESDASGKGVSGDLLDIFIKEFHPSTWFKADERLDRGANQSKMRFICSVTPSKPNSLILSFVTVSQMCFFLIIFLKARLFRARNMLVGFFYVEKERIRLGYLHSALVKQRTNLHEVLYRVARSNHRRYHSTKNCSYNYCSCCTTSHDSSWRLRGAVIDATSPNDIQRQVASASSRSRLCLRRLNRLIRKLFHSKQKCFVCSDGSKAIEKYSCLTDGCCGHYCMTCFYDMNQMCPLCLQGNGCQDEDHQGTSSCTKVDV